jgi:outer membrane protein assembly factor BamB
VSQPPPPMGPWPPVPGGPPTRSAGAAPGPAGYPAPPPGPPGVPSWAGLPTPGGPAAASPLPGGSPPSRRARGRWVVIGAIVVAVVVAGFAVVLVGGGDDDPDAGAPADARTPTVVGEEAWRITGFVGVAGVVGDTVLVAGAGDAGVELTGIDLATGDEVGVLGHGTSDVWTDGEVLYSGGGRSGTVVDLATGDELVELDLPSSPAFGPGLVVAFADGELLGADLRTGEERWLLVADVVGAPWVEDGLVLWIDGDGVVHAHDAEGGDEIWTAAGYQRSDQLRTGVEHARFAGPVPDDGIVVVVDGDEVVGLDAGDGAERWSAGPWLERTEFVVADGTLALALVSDPDPVVAGFDLESGEERWRVDARASLTILEPGQLRLDGAVVDLASGTATETGGRRVLSSSPDLVALHDEQRSALVVVEAGSGDEVWSVDVDGLGYAFLLGSVVVVTETDGEVVGYDVGDGAERWRVDTGFAFPLAIVTPGGLLLDDQDRTLVLIR